MSEARERQAVLAILAIAFALRVGFSLILPPFQAPDERAHLDYVRTLVLQHGLPVQPDLSPGEALVSWPQSYQPPLAYLLFAPTAALAHGLEPGRIPMLRALRLQNVLYGTLLVAIVFGIAARLRPVGDPLRLLAPLLVATLPGLIANSSSLNNDALAILLAAAFWWSWLRQPPGVNRGLVLGGVLGAACLAKLTAATLAPLCLVLPWLERRDLRAAALEACAAAGAVLFLLFPWMLRNVAVYGDPLAIGVGSFSFEALASAGLPAAFLEEAARPAPGKALFQLFGRFGITNNLSIGAVGWVWPILAALAAAGGLRRRDASHALPAPCAAGFWIAAALTTLGLVAFSLRYYGAWQGRYLYVCAAPLALLLGQGLSLALPRSRTLPVLGVVGIVGAGLTGLAVAVLWRLSLFFAEAPRAEWGLRTLL